MHKKGKSVSLILGSGAARGLTHIGVIRWLEETHYRIESISGCSIGALVGGVYAAGKLDEFERWICQITKRDMLTLMDLSFSKDGFIKGEKIINTLKELIGECAIEDLPIPFTALAADIKNEKEIWLNSGCLFDAIRASASFPFFFKPFKYHGKTLIDGGMLNPLPIAPTLNDKTDLTIAVNLNGHPDMDKIMPIKAKAVSEASYFKKNIHKFIASLKTPPHEKSERDRNMYRIAVQSFEAMQGAIARQKLAAYPPDVLIDIPRNACGALEFDRANEMIAFGYYKANELLERI
ncbi:patatin-like phospholipase family protein [Verrucomicrobiota bacterium]